MGGWAVDGWAVGRLGGWHSKKNERLTVSQLDSWSVGRNKKMGGCGPPLHKKKRKQAPVKMADDASEKFLAASMEKLKKTQALAQQMKEIQEQFKRETEEQDEMLKKFQQEQQAALGAAAAGMGAAAGRVGAGVGGGAGGIDANNIEKNTPETPQITAAASKDTGAGGAGAMLSFLGTGDARSDSSSSLSFSSDAKNENTTTKKKAASKAAGKTAKDKKEGKGVSDADEFVMCEYPGCLTPFKVCMTMAATMKNHNDRHHREATGGSAEGVCVCVLLVCLFC